MKKVGMVLMLVALLAGCDDGEPGAADMTVDGAVDGAVDVVDGTADLSAEIEAQINALLAAQEAKLQSECTCWLQPGIDDVDACVADSLAATARVEDGECMRAIYADMPDEALAYLECQTSNRLLPLACYEERACPQDEAERSDRFLECLHEGVVSCTEGRDQAFVDAYNACQEQLAQP